MPPAQGCRHVEVEVLPIAAGRRAARAERSLTADGVRPRQGKVGGWDSGVPGTRGFLASHSQQRGRDEKREPDSLVADRVVHDRASGCDEYEQEGAQQLGEEPSPLEARVVELGLQAELERQQLSGPGTEKI